MKGPSAIQISVPNTKVLYFPYSLQFWNMEFTNSIFQTLYFKCFQPNYVMITVASVAYK